MTKTYYEQKTRAEINYAQSMVKAVFGIIEKTDADTLENYFGMSEEERIALLSETYEIDVGTRYNEVITAKKDPKEDINTLTFKHDFHQLPLAQQLGSIAYHVKLLSNDKGNKYNHTEIPFATVSAATAFAVSMGAYEMPVLQSIGYSCIAFGTNVWVNATGDQKQRTNASKFQARFNHYASPLSGGDVYYDHPEECSPWQKIKSQLFHPLRIGNISESESHFINAKIALEEKNNPAPKTPLTLMKDVTKNVLYDIRNARVEKEKREQEKERAHAEKLRNYNNNNSKPGP